MINFPSSLDSLTNPEAGSALNSPSHSDQHINSNDAIEALEAKVGVDSSAVTTSHDYKIAQLESGKQDALVSGTNIKTINSTSLLGSGDIEISGGGGLSWVAKTTTYTAENGEGILADTSGGAWALTLPATPTVGDMVGVSDSKGNFQTNNLTIARNGSNIMGSAEDLVVDINDASFMLVYTGATDGWKIDTFMPYGSDISKATGAEVNTGTNDEKYVTPKAIDDSDYIKSAYLGDNDYQQIKITATEPSSPTTGDLWLDIS